LFEKIEDEAVEKQLEKLKKTKMQNMESTTTAIAQKDFVSYDDFTKMDIRVGTILEAEKVPKTKKLLKLTIDTGIDRRIVVSGIAEFFEPQDIVGKQVNILVNLEPREIKGIQSQGMILLAEDEDGKLTFVIPETKVKPGSIVK